MEVKMVATAPTPLHDTAQPVPKPKGMLTTAEAVATVQRSSRRVLLLFKLDEVALSWMLREAFPPLPAVSTIPPTMQAPVSKSRVAPGFTYLGW